MIRSTTTRILYARCSGLIETNELRSMPRVRMLQL